MSQARRHHVVPRSYLLRFADESGLLSMLDMANGTWSMPHASDAAVRIGFYTVDMDTGPSDEVERALGTIEGGMIEVLRRLDHGLWPPDEQTRQAIANFVGLQVVRGADFRERIDDFHNRVARKMARLMGATGAGLRAAFRETQGREPEDEELEELKRGLSRAEVSAEVPRNLHVLTMLQSAGTQAYVSYAKRLHLLTSEGEGLFVTSDAPVAMWTESPGPFGSTSLMMADEVYLPVDPQKCLLLTHPEDEHRRGAETRQRVARARAREINLRIAAQAHRFVFCRLGTETQAGMSSHSGEEAWPNRSES